jgi:pyruvate,orthophosphate dikinase
MSFAFDFDGPHEADKTVLGGKGAGLATMTRIGLPVPPGFTLSTAACLRTLAEGSLPDEVWTETVAAVQRLEARTRRSFGGATGTPLLLSVRSGARFSMPGMMDTVLNLGITESAIAALGVWSGRDQFPGDVARRFVQTYGGVVLGVDSAIFQHILTDLRQRRGSDDSGLTADDLVEARRRFVEALAAAGADPR